MQFSNARLAYPKDETHGASDASSSTIETPENKTNRLASLASTSASSELYLKNFPIFLPNWKDRDGAKHGSDRKGGIAIIGKNGSGKTLLGKAIIAAGDAASVNDPFPPNPYVLSGSVGMPLRESVASDSDSSRENRHLLGRAGGPTRRRSSQKSTYTVAHVSFDSHRRLLEERDEKTGEAMTAFKAIASAGHAPGRLNPAARFLVIRFGIFPMLHRTVDTLSTGEIRKVLLARALSTKPSLLILDHAFDGLDLPSRKILQELVSKTIRGFTNDLLVQGISSKDTADKTQVVLMAHRAEELDEIQELDTVAWWGKRGGGSTSSGSEDNWHVMRRRLSLAQNNGDGTNAEDDSTWSSGKEVLYRAMGLNHLTTKPSKEDTAVDIDWEDPITTATSSSLPSEENVRKWWNRGLLEEKPSAGLVSGGNQEVLVKARDLTVRKGDDIILLKNLTWTVRRGERWIVGGGNGAGKSTLSRLLALHPMAAEAEAEGSSEKENNNLQLQILPNRDPDDPRTTIGWVSTESHMQIQQQQQLQQQDRLSESLATTREFLLDQSRNASWDDAILPVLEWLGIGCRFLDRPFHSLSQGEQKMVLLAAAVAARPPLLVLDEPCQGLDLVNRTRLLKVVDTICRSTDMALIYITHHLDEERMLLPSISHALHLKDRSGVYRGPIEDYAPEEHHFDDDDDDKEPPQ